MNGMNFFLIAVLESELLYNTRTCVYFFYEKKRDRLNVIRLEKMLRNVCYVSFIFSTRPFRPFIIIISIII